MANSLSPYQLLLQIAQDSRKNASDLPAQKEVQSLWSGIGFQVAGQRYVAPINEVSEILTVPGYTRLPGVKPWVSGVSNVRGRLVPVIDFVGFLGGRSTSSPRSKRILIVEFEDVVNGLVVDSVEGMQHFPLDGYRADTIPADVPEILRVFTAGHYTRNNELWTVFSLKQMISSDEFMAVAI